MGDMGRETHKKPEVALSIDERIALSEARETVARLSEREPAPEELTELGYEQRMARSRALELAVQAVLSAEVQFTTVTELAEAFYGFIWEGRVDA